MTMTVSRKEPLFKSTEIPELLRASRTSQGGDFANYILKYNGRLNKPLSFEQGYCLGVFAVYPYYTSLNSNEKLQETFGKDLNIAKIQGTVLLSSMYNTATHNVEGASEQLAGIIAAIFDYDIGNSEYGFLNPDAERLTDNCGTGGDTFPTFHVSTASAFVAAGAGVKVAKHGSPGNAMKSGSSDFITYLNIDSGLNYQPRAVEETIDGVGFCYIEALDSRYKIVHTQTHSVAHLAHMNDIIGPMTNPTNTEKLNIKVLGTNNVTPPHVIADAYRILNKKGITKVDTALIVKGLVNAERPAECMDEVSILEGGTTAAFLHGEGVELIHLDYTDFGLTHPAEPSEVSPPSLNKKDRLKFTLDTLKRETTEGAVNTVLANTGAVIAMSKGDFNFRDGTEAARVSLQNGEHWRIIEKVRQRLPLINQE